MPSRRNPRQPRPGGRPRRNDAGPWGGRPDGGRGGRPHGRRNGRPQGRPHGGPPHQRRDDGPPRPFRGILEIDQRGGARVLTPSLTLLPSPSDPRIPPHIVARFRLRTGALVEGTIGGPDGVVIDKVNDYSASVWAQVPEFMTGTVVAPDERLVLLGRERAGHDVFDAVTTMRLLELFCPIGKGQRALIVAPPKAGKTVLMQQLAHAIAAHNPETEVLVLLVDERPEEVTDMRRTIRGEVFASSSDSERGDHVRLAQLVLEYAKRKVETGKDVVLLLDSLTRMGRAFNIHQRGSGRTMSGGVDARALEIPKRLFGAARKIEDGGSLTIIATVLIETGSRMDELIFQEFKGTGNMELVLDRKLAEERLFPAINLITSGTRREELLFKHLTADHQALRSAIGRMSPREALTNVLKLLAMYPTNEMVLAKIR